MTNKRKPGISPSMMCAGIADTPEVLAIFEQTGIEYLHIDVMDGHFVPNLALSPDYAKQMIRMSRIPLDIHLMVEDPMTVIGWLPASPGGMVSLHAETVTSWTEADWETCRQILSGRGMKLLAAVKPDTPFECLAPYLGRLDGILIMTVHPGFAGQKMVPSTLDKIARCRRWLAEQGKEELLIQTDGNVSVENAIAMRRAGADLFVAGTASIFKNGAVTAERIETLRRAVEEA